jgi:G:T-mismatch repair DNA endonuclease (very short patch repair protein)
MSHADPKNPVTGDMFRCEKCGFEVQVVTECKCQDSCVDLNCCGQVMKNVTSQEVPSAVGK